MKVRGIFTTIQDAITSDSSLVSDDYTSYVNPLNYDFYVEKNKEYQVIGGVLRGEGMWLYVFDNDEIQIKPSILFKWINLECNDYIFYIDDNEQNLGVINKELSNISFWFERYIDEDDEVINIINKILDS